MTSTNPTPSNIDNTQQPQAKRLVSVIVSVYNEESVLREYYDEWSARAAELDGYDFELLFVNDGSNDLSSQIADDLAAADPRVRVLHFSRNFGHEAAMLAGIDHAGGDVLICMDADLQHPPALMGAMLERYRQGCDVVTMVRTADQALPWAKRLTSRWFYSIINRLSPTRMEPGASDFFLISSRVADVLRHDYRERTRFLRGLVQQVGFRSGSIEFVAPERHAGRSKYSMRRLLTLSATAIASFSKLPLKLGIYAGLLFGLLSMVLTVYSLVMWFVQRPVGGYTTLVIFLSVFASILLLVLGVIGYYVGFIFDEVKGRPTYIIERQTPDQQATSANPHP
ncbi:MAG: glycosyltransferase family 2 protein [Bacteroidales bacterium]|nr:glycosyltransferase family 2 protein [Bacteroidales bacterium]